MECDNDKLHAPLVAEAAPRRQRCAQRKWCVRAWRNKRMRGRAAVCAAGLAVAFAAFALGHLAFSVATGVATMVGGAVALGVGFSLSVPLVNHLVVERSAPSERGRRLAQLSMALFSGQFLASFVELVPGGYGLLFASAAATAVTAALAFGGAELAARSALAQKSQTP